MRPFSDRFPVSSTGRRSPWLAWIAAALVALPAFAWGPQTIVVSPTPGNAVQSGNDLLDAIDGIDDNSWSRRYVVHAESGVYDLGTQTLQMKPWVDVEGSGIESTLVFGDGNTSQQGLTRGLVEGANNAELRALTLSVVPRPETGRLFLLPILLEGTSPRLRNLRLQAFGGDEYCGGITGFGTKSWIEDVHIRSTCNSGVAVGIALDGGSGARPAIREVDVTVRNNATSGSAWGLFAQIGTAPAYVRDSQFVATGGAEAMGFYFRQDFGSFAGSSVEVTDSVFRGNGASQVNYGIRGESTELSLAVDRSTAAASGPGASYGIDNSFANGVIDVRGSQVSGATAAAVGSPVGPVRIGATQLAGGPVGAGVTCAGTYDESFAFFASTCPP